MTMPYTEAQLEAAFILRISGGVTKSNTGAGGTHGQTSINPGEGYPVWAPGNPGHVNIGAYYASDANFYGSGTGTPDTQPALPVASLQDSELPTLIAMVKVQIPHPGEHLENGVWTEITRSDWPRARMTRPGTNAVAFSSGAGTFEWNDWKMIPVDNGDIVRVYAGLRSTSFRSRLSVLGAQRGYPPPEIRDASNWIVEEVALMVIPPRMINEAPPCRLFPRSDGLGVGSGRRWPPPKSQQRSLRRRGYY